MEPVGARGPSRAIENGRTFEATPFDDGSVWPPRRREVLEALPTDPHELTVAVVGWFGRGRTESVDHESAYSACRDSSAVGTLCRPACVPPP